MPRRSFLFPLALALGLTACQREPAGLAERSLAPEGVAVRVDSVGPAFNASTMTFAHFTVTNGTRGRIWVTQCIEGTGAALQKPAAGDTWESVGYTMCYHGAPAQGAVLEPGRSLEGAVQVSSAGRYRVAVPFTDGRPQDIVLLATSEPFEAR